VLILDLYNKVYIIACSGSVPVGEAYLKVNNVNDYNNINLNFEGEWYMRTWHGGAIPILIGTLGIIPLRINNNHKIK